MKVSRRGEVQPRKFPLMLDGCGIAGARGLFGSVKISEPYKTAVKSNRRVPPTGLLKKTNPSISAGVVGADTGIAFVLAAGCQSQIFKSIVVWLAVFMINFRRHLTAHKKPRKTTGLIIFVLKSDPAGAVKNIHIASNVANLNLVGRPAQPPKHTGHRVIGQMISNFIKGHNISMPTHLTAVNI